MIDHLTLPVRDLAASRRFYDAVLAVVGLGIIAEDGPAVGYGQGHWQFGLVEEPDPAGVLHLAFRAKTRSQVEAFYAAAREAGAACNGKPGLRPAYGAGYFACYVLDPDGNNIEAVFRG